MGLVFGDPDMLPDEEQGDRPRQWCILFRTKYLAAFPKPMRHHATCGGHVCMVIIDTPDYSEREYDRCKAYIFRFFYDYTVINSWQRHQFFEINWNLKRMWERYA